MKKDEIKIGTTYIAKVTGKIAPVKITKENTHGGWDAVNTATGKTIRIKSAARLRKAAIVGQITDATMAKAPAAPAAMAKGAAKIKAATDAKANAAKPTTTKQAKKRSRRAPDSPGGRAMSIHRNLAAKPKRVSLLDAAATVLKSATAPMTAKAIVEQVTTKGLWTPGKGKTPHATLYAAMIREISKKEKDARFKKVERGLFTAA